MLRVAKGVTGGAERGGEDLDEVQIFWESGSSASQVGEHFFILRLGAGDESR